jgi:SAM-dependent methyltransferase
MIAPSPWVVRHAPHIPSGGRVLDLACGSGRHARWLAACGHPVLAVDRDAAALAGMREVAGIAVLAADLEGEDWPLAGQTFAGIVVTNYLWRPRLDDVLALLAPDGVLIYETFMVGHEAYGRPSNPDFLLRPSELRERAARAGLREIAWFEGKVSDPGPAVRQAICARRELTPG